MAPQLATVDVALNALSTAAIDDDAGELVLAHSCYNY